MCMVSFKDATIADFAECRGDIDAIRYLYAKMTGGQDESYRCRASRRMEVAKEQAGEIIEEQYQ